HLLERPRNAPTRTALLVSLMTFYGLMWAAGGNDLIAIKFNMSINSITHFMRGAVFIGPVIAFIVTRRWCISLQRHDNERLLHGYETGVVSRSADGGFSELHLPYTQEKQYALTARDRDEVYSPENDVDVNGVPATGTRGNRLRAKLSKFWYGPAVQKPTAADFHD